MQDIHLTECSFKTLGHCYASGSLSVIDCNIHMVSNPVKYGKENRKWGDLEENALWNFKVLLYNDNKRYVKQEWFPAKLELGTFRMTPRSSESQPWNMLY
jgi:hypothetical protein